MKINFLIKFISTTFFLTCLFPNFLICQTQIGQDITTTTTSVSDWDDISISGNGNVALVRHANLDTTISISAYNFEKDTWKQMGNKIEGPKLVNFGRKLQLSDDGNTLAMYSPDSIFVDSQNYCRAYFFENDEWVSFEQDLSEPCSDFSLSPDGMKMKFIKV